MTDIDYSRITVQEATILQKQLCDLVRLQPFSEPPATIAGADISFNRFSPIVFAGIVVFTYPDLQIIRTSLVRTESTFPYVPGYLSFREIPALQMAWDQLDIKPDLLILDGQGITHPRKFGIASHFGVANDQPTIGCAKKSLFGSFISPDIPRFSSNPISGKEGELIGHVLRTKNAVKPIFVSPGHLTDPDSALEIVKACTKGYRIPEPTRIAHETVNQFRKGLRPAGLHVETHEAAI